MERNIDNNLIDDDIKSSNLKMKILHWLININIIKDGAILIDDIPRMCANGVFLGDLINRLEGVILIFI